jgi:hypothetical protein
VLPDILRYNRTKPPFYPNGRRPIEDIPLASQGTRVTALHVGYMDTDMTRSHNV